ncbi:MAG: class I SAM-dependent methyltransferase [Firmicutes bacterium]|nr:class I SAM-dependent methyltransferase [Bacillota bacterium]
MIANMRYAKVRRLVPAGSVLCDLGCGPDGRFLQALLDSGTISKGYGFDRNVDRVRERGEMVLSPLDLNSGIPLQGASIDCVTMLALLEHLSKPAAVIEDVFRVLKPGGRIILTTPSPCSKALLEFLAFRLQLISAEEIRDHKRYYSETDLRALLGDKSFTGVVYKRFQFGLNQLVAASKPAT